MAACHTGIFKAEKNGRKSTQVQELLSSGAYKCSHLGCPISHFAGRSSSSWRLAKDENEADAYDPEYDDNVSGRKRKRTRNGSSSKTAQHIQCFTVPFVADGMKKHRMMYKASANENANGWEGI